MTAIKKNSLSDVYFYHNVETIIQQKLKRLNFRLQLRWLTTVLMEYKGTTFNSFKKGSKLFFPSLFTVCLRLLRFYVKFEQLNVNK